jgi:hypothetical protein
MQMKVQQYLLEFNMFRALSSRGVPILRIRIQWLDFPSMHSDNQPDTIEILISAPAVPVPTARL